MVDSNALRGGGTRQSNQGGLGRNEGNKPGAGPGGMCICPDCGHKIKHDVNTPCYSIDCPKCGVRMRRE